MYRRGHLGFTRLGQKRGHPSSPEMMSSPCRSAPALGRGEYGTDRAAAPPVAPGGGGPRLGCPPYQGDNQRRAKPFTSEEKKGAAEHRRTDSPRRAWPVREPLPGGTDGERRMLAHDKAFSCIMGRLVESSSRPPD